MTTKRRFERKGKNDQKGQKGHALQFNVAQLLKHVGPSSRTYTIEKGSVPALQQEFSLTNPLNGKVKFIKTDKNIFVIGNLETELLLSCTRCLTDVTVPIAFDIEETFSPTIDITTGSKLPQESEVDEATLISEQHILDLIEVVRQAIHLSQPLQVLCQEDCLGLCSQCGVNKNLDSCNCKTDNIDVRWAGLLALKDDFS